jgi:hypothetical protein
MLLGFGDSPGASYGAVVTVASRRDGQRGHVLAGP